MRKVTFIKKNYQKRKNSPKYLKEAIRMMKGSIVKEDSSQIIAIFPEENNSASIILSNAHFWANVR